jgi:hypothetical protein
VQKNAKDAKDIADRIRHYVNPNSPLGPSDAAQITDTEVAARLFDPHNKSFNSLLRKDLSVVIGRRGSGKTALLDCYKYRRYLGRIDNLDIAPIGSDFSDYDIVIEIVPYKTFDEMQRQVVKDQTSFRPIESVVDDWSKLITDYFLAKLAAEEHIETIRSHHLTIIQEYLQQDESIFEDEVRQAIWGKSIWSKLKRIWTAKEREEIQYILQDDAMKAAEAHLKKNRKRAVMIFDSMDEYNIGNRAFDRTIGALLRFTDHFNKTYDCIKIKLGLPSEIFPEVQRASGNPLKDLISFDQIQWTPMELAQVAAYRYHLFLELYDSEHGQRLREFNLNHRDDVHRFWSHFFPKTQVNRFGTEEDVMTYVLRHTQLLPRQLFMILQRIVISSQRATGGYREFKSDAIRGSIEEIEPIIAGEIFGAFQHVYSFADAVGKAVFGNFPTIFSYDQLENQWRKKARHQMSKLNIEFEMVHFTEMLVRMGIIGLVQTETDRYYEGQFGYNLLVPFNIGSGNQLCLHPIFSKYFNAVGNPKSKAIIPQEVTTIGQ